MIPDAPARLAAWAGSLVRTRSRGEARVGERAHQRLTYRPELDGLRGVAVLAVMLYHYNWPYDPGNFVGAQHGFFGVDVFFVLSGFLITSILGTEWARTGQVDWRRFYLRRALRLLPAFWLMIAVVATMIPIASTIAALTYTINWTMALDLLPAEAPIGPVWSLAVEWQFYLLWPLALVFMLSRWSPRTVVLATLVLAAGSALWRAVLWQMDPDWIRVFTGTDTHADGILLGSAIGLAAATGQPFVGSRAATWAAGLFAVALVVVGNRPNGEYAVAGDALVALAAAAVIIRPGGLGHILAWRPLVAIGVISYGIYLWHVPVRYVLAEIGVEWPPAVVLTLIVAALSYRYVERPILRWKGRVPSPALAYVAMKR